MGTIVVCTYVIGGFVSILQSCCWLRRMHIRYDDGMVVSLMERIEFRQYHNMSNTSLAIIILAALALTTIVPAVSGTSLLQQAKATSLKHSSLCRHDPLI